MFHIISGNGAGTESSKNQKRRGCQGVIPSKTVSFKKSYSGRSRISEMEGRQPLFDCVKIKKFWIGGMGGGVWE